MNLSAQPMFVKYAYPSPHLIKKVVLIQEQLALLTREIAELQIELGELDAARVKEEMVAADARIPEIVLDKLKNWDKEVSEGMAAADPARKEAVRQKIEQEIRQGNAVQNQAQDQLRRVREEVAKDFLSPEHRQAQDRVKAGLKKIRTVCDANSIPIAVQQTGGILDFILPNHAATHDLKEMIEHCLGQGGWTLNGQLNGPPADIRKRPDLYDRPGTGHRTVEVPIDPVQHPPLFPPVSIPYQTVPGTPPTQASGFVPGVRPASAPFDGTTGPPADGKAGRVTERIPNASDAKE